LMLTLLFIGQKYIATLLFRNFLKADAHPGKAFVF
jgi:hypothetical protein